MPMTKICTNSSRYIKFIAITPYLPMIKITFVFFRVGSTLLKFALLKFTMRF